MHVQSPQPVPSCARWVTGPPWSPFFFRLTSVLNHATVWPAEVEGDMKFCSTFPEGHRHSRNKTLLWERFSQQMPDTLGSGDREFQINVTPGWYPYKYTDIFYFVLLPSPYLSPPPTRGVKEAFPSRELSPVITVPVAAAHAQHPLLCPESFKQRPPSINRALLSRARIL